MRKSDPGVKYVKFLNKVFSEAEKYVLVQIKFENFINFPLIN